MVDLKEVLNKMKSLQIEFVTGVPDTLLNDFCLALERGWDKDSHVITANEGNAIAMATGRFLASGKVPLVYMQNSGMGNTVNPLLSLTNKEVYGIPMVLLIGWRGKPGSNDWPQHDKQGAITMDLLSILGIRYRELGSTIEEVGRDLSWSKEEALSTSSPTALIVGKNILAKGEKDGFDASQEYSLSREDAMRIVCDNFSDKSLYVASTGRATRELYEIRNLQKESHSRDFLNVGAMGHTSSIALGLASGNPDCDVICFDGDASVIMHMGSLSMASIVKADNFFHFVLNNGVHESVGGQLSPGYKIQLTEIARNSGYKTIQSYVSTESEIRNAIDELKTKDGPKFLEIRIKKGMRADLPKLIFNPSDLKESFMNEISSYK